MAYLGERQRSEAIRFILILDTAPTGTPTVTVTRGGVSVLTATNMIVGASNLEWYYDYTTGAAATVGAHEVKYIAIVDGVTRFDYDAYDQKINDIDDVKTDTETIIANIGVTTGDKSIILNIKDSVPNPVSDVNVGFYNVDNDDSPIFATRSSDTAGVTAGANLDGSVSVPVTYTLRLLKNGVVNETQQIVVTQSETITITVTPISVSPPADPGVCKLFFFPQSISQADVTDAVVRVRTSTDLALIGGVYVDNRESLMVADTSTDPDNYYINAKIGAEVRIFGPIFGFNHTITVPDQATLDLSTLILT